MALPALLLTLVLAGYVAARGGQVQEDELRSALPYLIAGSHLGVFGILLWLLRRERRDLGDIGWACDEAGGRVLGAVLLGVFAGLVLYLFKETVLDGAEALLAGRRPTFTSLFRFRWDPTELPLLVVATTLVAVEESVYRGYGLAALDARWPRARAVAAMAVLFGLLHWGNGLLAIVFTGVLGLGFAALYLWRRRLVVPFVAHAVYNALVILT